MIIRYKKLYSELKLIEYQLKNRCKNKFGKVISDKSLLDKYGFIKPKVFEQLLGGKNGKK